MNTLTKEQLLELIAQGKQAREELKKQEELEIQKENGKFFQDLEFQELVKLRKMLEVGMKVNFNFEYNLSYIYDLNCYYQEHNNQDHFYDDLYDFNIRSSYENYQASELKKWLGTYQPEQAAKFDNFLTTVENFKNKKDQFMIKHNLTQDSFHKMMVAGEHQ